MADKITKVAPLVGILGGVGPMAGVGLHTKLIELTKASCDQDHLNVVHLSVSQYVGDRTNFLLQGGENPGDGMFKAVLAASNSAKALGTTCVVGVPCNTFHAPPIFERFTGLIEQHNRSFTNKQEPGYVDCLHMINLAMDYLEAQGFAKVGLMSVTGLRRMGLYQKLAQERGIEIVQVKESQQDEVHDSICNREFGIKALSRACPEVRAKYEGWVKQLKEQEGAESVILGCTEIPIALPEPSLYGIPLVDPVQMLACELISRVDQTKLVELHAKM